MTRRDIFKRFTAIAASMPALAGTRRKGVGILVRIQERHSDLCLLRSGVEVSRRCIPIGRGHFINDVAICLKVERDCAAELVRKYGLPAREEHCGTDDPAPHRERRVIRNADGSVVSVPRELYVPVMEARGAEFAALVRDGVTAMRPGNAPNTAILLGGQWIRGLDSLIERGELWRNA